MAFGSGCLGLIKSVLRFTAIATLIGIIGLGFSYLLFKLMVSTEEVKIPNVINMPIEQAVLVLTDADLAVGEVTGHFNEEFASGRVIGQEPQPGRMVKSQRKIHLQKSLGSQMVEVPDVRGLTASDAEMESNRNSVVSHFQTHVHHDTVPMGQVITTSPPPGSSIVKSGNLNLLISLGPRAEAYVMPDVRNMDLNEAGEGFQSMGVEVHVQRVEAESLLEDNRILDQNPAPGSRVRSGDRVDLRVATASGAPSRSSLRLFQTRLPADALRLPVRIEIHDERGLRTVFQDRGVDELKFKRWLWMVGVAEVIVYVNGEVVDQQVYRPDSESFSF